MLQLKNVTKKYKTKAGEVCALNGVSLTFPSTGMVFITGKSGCGKTTLLNIIGGLDSVDSGEIYVQEKSLSAFSAKEYDSYRNTFVGFVFQEYNLLAEYTVEYNVKIAMELQGKQADEAEVERLLKEMEIENFRNRKPAELSGGQRQRVAIARALVKEPRIIMADEPTGALDSATGIQVFDALKKLSKDKLVIVISHDNEFAEKYADRIIRLVDGRVVEDITFTSRELNANISEQENMLVVKEGAELSEADKDALAKAIKERKKIEVTEKLCYREKIETDEVTWNAMPTVALKESKMKLKSSAYLGVKSLVVKPVRLIITILISALAFAVFGLFDTIANFNTHKILKNSLLKNDSTVAINTSYIIDESVGDSYEVKTSQAIVDRLAQETGGAVKGIFDFRYNTSGQVLQSQSIIELAQSKMVIGKSYYSSVVNGFLEFDDEKELDGQGNFRDFDYRLTAGRYPKLLYNNRGVLMKESLYEVAISTYLADSILYFLNGEKLNDEEVGSYNDLLGKQITIGEDKFTIVGLVDCGEIPKKYDEIKQSTPYNMQLNGLLDDYKAYMDSSARKCLFVDYGFKEEYKTLRDKVSVFYAGDNDLKLVLPSDGEKVKDKTVANYVYDSRAYDEENILLFSGTYPSDTKLALKDDEIVVYYKNFREMLWSEISNAKKRQEIDELLVNFSNGTKEKNREVLKEICNKVPTWNQPFSTTIKQYSKQTGKTLEKEVKIVGIYFGVDEARLLDGSYRLMMNGNLMQTLNICNEQGDYSKILFSEKSVRKGADTIVEYLVAKKGVSFTWYNNSILTIIEENQTIVEQAAELFLYATIALAVFAVFMLYNYISTSISNKQRSVGVLRGLGACGKDIFFAFLTESLIIALINGVLASVLSAVGCMLVNLYIREVMHVFVSFALFGVRQVLLIMGVSLLLSVLSSALPIIKISKKKPVELIRQP